MTQNWDMGGNDLVVNTVSVGATAPGQAGTSLSGSELTVLDSVTPGTAAASKALVLNASKGISTITSATITTLTSTTNNSTTNNSTTNNVTTDNVGASGTAGTVNVFPTTASKGKIVVQAADSAGDTATTITNASQAGSRTYTIPDGGASANFVLSTGTSTATTATSTELTTLAGATNANSTTGKVAILGTNGAFTHTGAHTLPAGTTALAPLVFTSGTNLTTAAAGALEFDGTAFYATAAASSRQQLDAEQFVLATADSATYNNTLLDTATAAPVFTTTTSGTSAGAVTLIAGKTYFFEAVYLLTNTGTTSHTWATLFAGAASLTSIAYSIFGLSSTTAAPSTGGLTGWASAATATVATAASTSATENVTIMLNGTVVVNAGGTFIPQLIASARPGASGTPGVVIKKGSFFRIWEMSSSAAVGNWS